MIAATLIDAGIGLAFVAAAFFVVFFVKNPKARAGLLTLVGFGAGGWWRSRQPDDEAELDEKPAVEVPPADTATFELDDSINFEVIDESTDLDPSDYSDDDPDVVDKLSDWANNV